MRKAGVGNLTLTYGDTLVDLVLPSVPSVMSMRGWVTARADRPMR